MEVAEALALQQLMQVCDELDLVYDVFEGDCLRVV